MEGWTGMGHLPEVDVREARNRAEFPRWGNFAEFRFRNHQLEHSESHRYGFGNACHYKLCLDNFLPYCSIIEDRKFPKHSERSRTQEESMRKAALYFVAGILFFWSFLSAQEQYWFKGNTHCHTTHSDGDAPPEKVVKWYKNHGYHFLVITDHDVLVDIEPLDTDKTDDFLLISGEEISDSYNGAPIHLNAINITDIIEQQHGNSKVEVLQNNIDAIIQAGGIATINHPNWRWAFTDVEMSQLKNVQLFEIYNFSYNCNNFGAGGYPGMEEVWDRMLSKGILMYGIATDDAHDYTGEFSAKRSNPGTGWIMVRASELTAAAILEALEKGDFYSTIGVLLENITITGKSYTVEIEQEDDMKYTTQFIGKGGQILTEVFGTPAAYEFQGDELYVRARIFASSGEFACTQPIFLKENTSH